MAVFTKESGSSMRDTVRGDWRIEMGLIGRGGGRGMRGPGGK